MNKGLICCHCVIILIWLRYEYEISIDTYPLLHYPTYTQRIIHTEKAIFLSTMAQTNGSINPVNAVAQRVFYNNIPPISM